MDLLRNYSGDQKNLLAKIQLIQQQIVLWKLCHDHLMSINVKNHDGYGTSHHRPSNKVTVPLKTFVALACDKLGSLSDKQRMMVHLSPQEFRMLSDDHLNELQRELAKIARKAESDINSNFKLSKLHEEIEDGIQSLLQQTTAMDINSKIDKADSYIQSCHGLPFVSADIIWKANNKGIQNPRKQLTIQ